MEKEERQLMIFLAGELRNKANLLHLINNNSLDFYAADGGYRLAQELNLPLKRVFGDFDSTEKPDHPNIMVFPCEKDQTDSELALDIAIEDGYHSLWMIAPFGGRIDHTIANIHLLEKSYKNGVSLKLYDGENLVFLLPRGIHSVSSNYQYISFFPIDESAIVTLSGFKFSLQKISVKRDTPLMISNEPLDNPTVEIHRGALLCVCIEKEII